jgi:aminoglycoside phosphotransferase family enzyme
MLDQATHEGTVTAAELQALIAKLAGFYKRTAHAPWDEDEFLRRLDQSSVSFGSRLSEPEFGLDEKLIQRLIADQRSFIEDRAGQLAARIAQGRVVDTHGDLRPEHIFLADNPQIIDCLEFSTELRLQDSAEEIAFLALECERLGQSRIAEQILGLYRDSSEDPVSPELLQFYRSRRALVRALLSAWHLENADIPDAEHWIQRAYWYLDAARESIERAL